MESNRSTAGSFLTMGIQLAIAVVGFFFAGYWLDAQWNTRPWLSIAGAVIGAGGGLAKFIHEAMKLGAEEDEDTKARKRESWLNKS
jgi:F0F1-type ATP synthase assembly protein I